MAYYVNGKTFTDHPLMDEISYNCKLILKGIVIKNDELAAQKETATSLDDAELYFIQHDTGRISFGIYPFNYEILHEFGYLDSDIEVYLKDKNNIPMADRESLTTLANEYFAEHFEEQNNYYRMLMGLPGYNTGDEYFIYLSESDLPAKYNKEVDLSLPLHMQPKGFIDLLYSEGKIDKLREVYPGSNYSYMMYLGSKSIDLYTARKAKKWDILYMPSVYYLIEDRFTELYTANREIYINRSYQDFFAQSGDYYDQLMILIVLCQTFADMITEVPEWYIRRDIFDIRSCKYFLESSGIEFFNIIPLKYQIRIVKNINSLIKYKSTTKNVFDIIDIFDIPGISIFKYWLYKRRDKNADSGYELEFISSSIDESYDNYVKDSKYRTNYDDITLYDKYWDGQEDHNDVKNRILAQDFTIQGTKYMSVEYQISMKKYQYQMNYLLGLILDSVLYNSLSDIRIAIPSIDENASFKLADLFLLLIILTDSYYRDNLESDETKIREPEDMSIGSEPTVDEDHYDWKKKYFPEIFVLKNGRVKGFNTKLNKEALRKELKTRHSHYRFGQGDEYGDPILTEAQYSERAEGWLDEIGFNKFIVPGSDINSIDRLVEVYRNNTECYDALYDALANVENEDNKKYLEYVYQELFTREYDTNFYTKVSGGKVVKFEDLVDVLKDRDFILYELFIRIIKEDNIETKQELMRSIMNDIISTLDYYLSGEGMEYLYSFTSIESFSSIIYYIYLMVNFFKSYKVYFLDPYYTLIADDKIDNTAKPIDVINGILIESEKWDKQFAADIINGINITRYFKEDPNTTEAVDFYSHYDPDPLMDLDFDGVTAEKGEEETVDVDGGTADESSAYPYIMVNCGRSHPGNVNMNDVNGGEANEAGKEYFSIDGGEAYDPDVNKTDAMGSQMFNYMLDGGSASFKEFISNTMHIKLDGKDLVAYAIISNMDKYIHILDDGLYIDGDQFVPIDGLYKFVEELKEWVDYIDTKYSAVLAEYAEIGDERKLHATIDKLVNEYLYYMMYVLNLINNNLLINKLKEFVDIFCTLLSNNIDTNPFSWEELG